MEQDEDVSVGSSGEVTAYRRGFPIKLEWGGHGRGRYVVSARPIKRGEVVLEALPFALAPKLPSLTCTRCFRFHPPPAAAPSPSPPPPHAATSTSATEASELRFEDDDGDDDDETRPQRAGGQQRLSARGEGGGLRPCSQGCDAAFYCSAEEEADDRPLHDLECAAWRRVREVGASMELTESEETELRLVFRIAARHHRELLDRQFADGDEADDAKTTMTMKKKKNEKDSGEEDRVSELTEPTYDDVLRLCSNREKRPLEEMTFWRRVVQRVVAPLVQAEQQGSSPAGSGGGGVAWSQYDFVELICKNLCNGFGLRGAGGQCYAYGVYPAASYFNHSCYPNICRIEQDAGSSPGRDRQRFVALADIRAGDELSLSYIDASKPTEQRRLALSSIYFFHCMCARCENGTTRGRSKNNRAKTKDDYVQRFVCSSCTKHNGRGVMYPCSSTHDRCNLCHRVVARRATGKGSGSTATSSKKQKQKSVRSEVAATRSSSQTSKPGR